MTSNKSALDKLLRQCAGHYGGGKRADRAFAHLRLRLIAMQDVIDIVCKAITLPDDGQEYHVAVAFALQTLDGIEKLQEEALHVQ